MANQNHRNSERWHKAVLENLYHNRDAGFVLMAASLPLLERYLREKSQVFEHKINDQFYDELLSAFPRLKTRQIAAKFWRLYRHGILHQMTLKRDRAEQDHLTAELSGDDHIPAVELRGDDRVVVNPAKFARRVVDIIEGDFATFEGQNSKNHPPAQERQRRSYLGSSSA